MNQFKNLFNRALTLRETAVVDDDFPEAMHNFDTVIRTISKLPEMPKIVCLCGSTKFKQQFIEANFNLTKQGIIVLSVGWFSHDIAETQPPTYEEKLKLDELHKRKIDLADEVLVLNVDGYIGESTKSEIHYAKTTGKKVVYLESNNDNF